MIKVISVINFSQRAKTHKRVKTHLINGCFFASIFAIISCYCLVGLRFFTPIGRGSGAEYIGIIFMLMTLDFAYRI